MAAKKTALTAKTMKMLRDDGWFVEKVEYWNAFAKRRKDLFGIIDVVAIKEGEPGVLGIQVTSKANISARKKKAKEAPELAAWLSCGNRFVVHGWFLRATGRRKWCVKEVDISLAG